jgi:hypothetical protein
VSRRSGATQTDLPDNVRHITGVGWQVLVNSSNDWQTCRGELDACFIASGLRKSAAVLRGELGGAEVAEELDAVAVVAERNLGPGSSAPISSAAELARGQRTA